MLTFLVEIDASGVEQLFSLAKADLASGFNRPLKQAGQRIARRLSIAFDRGGYGTQWQSLAKGTLRARRKRGNFSTKPLLDGGGYRAAVTALQPDVKESAFALDSSALTMGTVSAKAFNQYPPRKTRRNRRRNTPVRALPTEFDDNLTREIEDDFGTDLTARMRRVQKGG